MLINLDFFTKCNLSNFFYFQFSVLYLIYIFALILTYKTYSPIAASISMTIIFYYSYFIHILFHNLPDKFNVHLFHHNHTEIDKFKIINFVIELITNIMFFVGFYFLQKLINITFVPNILIFYYAFLYTSIHMVNYSIFNLGENHYHHHFSLDKNKNVCNYGPDVLDHLFNTNYNNNYENYNHIIPNVLLSFLTAYYIYKPEIF
jgi:hypothetical protein